MSTSGGYHDTCGRYHEYVSGRSVHQGDIMSTSGGYHEYIGDVQYIGGCSVQWGFQQKLKGFYQVAPPQVS